MPQNLKSVEKALLFLGEEAKISLTINCAWNDEDIEKIFDRGKRVKLQKIKGLRGTKLIMVIAASVIGGGWLISTLFDYIMAPPQRKVVAPVRPKVVQTAPVVIPKPWEKIKDPTAFMNNCYKGVIDMTSLMPPGWTSSGKVLCTGETVATSWKKGVGMLGWADEAMRKSGFDNLHYKFDEKGVNLSATMSLPKLETVNMQPQKTLDDLRFEINKQFQEMGISINLTTKIVKLRAPAAAAGPKGPMAKGPKPKGPMAMGPKGKPAETEIKVLSFKLKSEYNPVTWLKFLTKFSSFEINNINYEINSSSWNYEGVFYVL